MKDKAHASATDSPQWIKSENFRWIEIVSPEKKIPELTKCLLYNDLMYRKLNKNLENNL